MSRSKVDPELMSCLGTASPIGRSVGGHRCEQIRITREAPFAILFSENRERMARSRDRRGAARWCDDDSELRPHVSPLAVHLDFLDLARTLEARRIGARLSPRGAFEIGFAHRRLAG